MIESDNYNLLLHLLSSDKAQDLVLFVGAGINGGTLPSWDKLLAVLMEKSLNYALGGKDRYRTIDIPKLQQWATNPANLDFYSQAELVRRFLGPQYVHTLRSALYKNFDEGEWDGFLKKLGENSCGGNSKFATIERLSQLCQQKRIRAVVTTNYDSLLLEAINDVAKSTGRKAFAVFGNKQQQAPNRNIPIYYIHGYLPREQYQYISEENAVVLARDEYLHQFETTYSWQNSTTLYLLRRYLCLFIGMSMTDMNVLRLTSHASSFAENVTFFVIKARQDFIDRKNENENDDLQEGKCFLASTLLSAENIRMILVDKYSDIDILLQKIKKELG